MLGGGEYRGGRYPSRPQLPSFSQEDIWHAMRLWGCNERQALNGLIAEEKRFAEDDR